LKLFDLHLAMAAYIHLFLIAMCMVFHWASASVSEGEETAISTSPNPVRKVVTMLRLMQKRGRRH